MYILTKEQLLEKLTQECESLRETILKMEEDAFFAHIEPGKWSAAENVHHLLLAVRPLLLAFALPHWALRLFGKPSRASLSYEEVVTLYQEKLRMGAKASLPYIPSRKNQGNKEKQMEKMLTGYKRLQINLKPWPDALLDRYFLPHPILGRITLREMICFTIYHIQHHHLIIRQRYTL